MEILVISHKYPPSIGGMQTHCYELVKSLEKNHRVHKVIFRSNYPKLFFLLTAAYRARKLIRKNPAIEVIYTNDALMALFCLPLLKRTSVPIAVTIHGLDITFPAKWYQKRVKKYLSRFDKLITVSGPTTELALRKGLDPDRVARVDNAVNVNLNAPPPQEGFRQRLSDMLRVDLHDKFIITSLGRAIPRKGFSWFTREVMPSLPDDCVYLIMARPAPQKKLFRFMKKVLPKSWYNGIRLILSAETDDDDIADAVKKYGLEKRVFRMTQFTHSRDDIFETIRQGDLFVMPNIHLKGDYEGFGLVALEAASQGTLTLAANTDGIPSAVVDGVTGYLVEPGNPKAWIERIRHFKQHPDELEQRAQEFRNNCASKSRSWDTMAAKYVEVFDDVINEKGNNR